MRLLAAMGTARAMKFDFYFMLCLILPLAQVDRRGIQLGLTAAASAEDELRLIQRFLNSSVKHTRPVKNTLDPVQVDFDITFHSVIEMDERFQILTTNMWVRQFWTNKFFQWDPKDYDGLTHVIVDSSEVWLPDVTLYNNVFEEFDGRMDHISTRVKIFNDGRTRWAAPFVFKTSCHIDVSNFPFDHQYCRLKFGSWQYEGSELDLWNMRNFSSKTNTSVEHGEWEVRNVTIRRNTPEYACCPNVTYPDVTFTIHLKRRSLFYIVNLILPNFLIALLGFFSFFIPVECGERISFVITVLLSMTVFLLLVAENIPPTSEAVPLIGVFYTLSIVEVALALVATGITLKIYYSYLYGHGLSPRMKRFLFQKLGPLLRFPAAHPTTQGAERKPSKSGDRSARLLRVVQDIKDILRSENENSYSLEDQRRKTNTPGVHMNGCAGSSQSPENPAGSDVELCMRRRHLSLSDVKLAGDLLGDEERKDTQHEAATESRLASAIVDRGFMWLFLIVFIVSTCAVFIMPTVNDGQRDP